MDSIFGGLLEFETEDQFDEFLKNIDEDNSLKIIELAIEYAYRNGLYSQPETYCIYKSLKKLKQKNESTQ
jgi:hypothetical protein